MLGRMNPTCHGPVNAVRDWLGPHEEFWRSKVSALQGVLGEESEAS
jgi:hypothetical protein